MSPADATTTVQLGPSPRQWVSAFVWVAIGLLISAMFFWIGLNDELIPVAVIIAVVIGVISLVSAVLEYRSLPGITLRFQDGRLKIDSRAGESADVAIDDVHRLETHYLQPVKRRRARADAMLPANQRPAFAAAGGRGGWRLRVLMTDESQTGPLQGYPIDLNEDLTEQLRAACQQHRVPLGLGQ